jgi:hypothetical protein
LSEELTENNSKFNEILETLKQSIWMICESEKEKDIQDILASQLNCNSRLTLSSPTFPDVEIDLISEDFAVEIKFNEKYYSGFCQILIQRLLYNLNNIYLIHINEYLNPKFINAFFKLAEELKILCILIDKRSKDILVKP